MLFRNSVYIYITVVGFPATRGAAMLPIISQRYGWLVGPRQTQYGEYNHQQSYHYSVITSTTYDMQLFYYTVTKVFEMIGKKYTSYCSAFWPALLIKP